MNTREYRSAAKGESWKFRLMNTIDQCMRYASSKEKFISLMKSEGYEVRWTENRKNITYTTPAGMKCRDNRLHEEKYTKEAMEHEFRIRAAFAHGGIEAEERSAIYNTAELSQQRGVGKSAADDPSVASVDGRAEKHSGEPEPAYRGPHSPSAGGFQPEGSYCSSHRIHEETLDNMVWEYLMAVRDSQTKERETLVKLQKMWVLRKPVLDAHILSLQKRIHELEQEIDDITIGKLLTKE